VNDRKKEREKEGEREREMREQLQNTGRNTVTTACIPQVKLTIACLVCVHVSL
jgi:hypothetical protein